MNLKEIRRLRHSIKRRQRLFAQYEAKRTTAATLREPSEEEKRISELMGFVSAGLPRSAAVIYLYEHGGISYNRLMKGISETMKIYYDLPGRSSDIWHIEKLLEAGIVNKVNPELYGLTEDGRKIYPGVKSVAEEMRLTNKYFSDEKKRGTIRMTPYADVSLAPLFE